MRIFQLSDLHLRGDGQLSFQVADTRHWLEVAADHLRRIVTRDDVIVFTGDLADNGDAGAYAMLYAALSPLPAPIYALPGNHDRRGLMQKLLPAWCPAEPDIAPYLCYVVENDPLRLILMDSMHPGSHSGHCHLPVARWLEQTLAAAPERPTLLFTHHPPFVTGMGAMDEPFENVELLAAVLRDNSQVRLCCGHMHRPIFTQWQGRAAMTAPSLSMQIDLDFSPQGGDAFRMETPGYLLHHWQAGVCNTHVCQIPCQATFSGPHPFVGSVNPTE